MSSVTKGIIEGLVSGAVGSYIGSKMVTETIFKVNNIDIPLSQIKAILDAIANKLTFDQYSWLYTVSRENLVARPLNVDETYIIPAGKVTYLKDIYISNGELYVDGEVKII